MAKETAIRKIDQRYSKRTIPVGQTAAGAATAVQAALNTHIADTAIHSTVHFGWGTPLIEGGAVHLLSKHTALGTVQSQVYDPVTYVVWFDAVLTAGGGSSFGTSGYLINQWSGGASHSVSLWDYGGGTVTLTVEDHTGGSNPDRLYVVNSGTATPVSVYLSLLIAK